MSQIRRIFACAGAACISSGCSDIVTALHDALDKHDLNEGVRVVETGCIGACDLGPTLVIEPELVFYQKVGPKDVEPLIESHFVDDELYVPNLVQADERTFHLLSEIPFFRKQHKVVLRDCGLMGAEDIQDYLAHRGYEALRKVVLMSPQEVIEEVKRSGLRGRGGAGFSTGMKWQFTHDATVTPKYIVCNADEGDPGAFMDRSVLEGDPHRILEAMTIAAYAVGASHGYIYVRAEYPLAIRRLQLALEQSRQAGFLGERILGSELDFDVEIRVGAGAFVCGEETALLASIEGKRGLPRPRPPFPAVSGVWGKPTVINNVETLANVPPILLDGAESFRTIGTERSSGTKVFALAGKINITGLVEVPMGTTLRDVIFDIGGGVPDGKAFKAAQTGGPSGGCIPAAHLDIPLEYDTLSEIDSIMGSGGLIIMDEDSCMVDVARFFMEFCVEESCGKCPPCRLGTKEMHVILTRIVEGQGTAGDLERLEYLARGVKDASLCGLGQTAPNPVLSTLRFFREEYEAHIHDRRCPAKACNQMLTFQIDAEACGGCKACVRACPTDTIFQIEGKKAFWINQAGCIKCGSCFDACPTEAVLKG